MGLRFTKELRDRLEEARRASARSLSQEIELRLWDSFTVQEKIEKRFGGPATAGLLEILAERIRSIEMYTGGPDAELRWYNDRFTYDQVRSMIEVVLDHFKPNGRRTIPKEMRGHPSLKNEVENLGRHNALLALAFLQSAAPFSRESGVPPLYNRAALPLGRRLRGSPVDELRNQQEQTRQVILKNFERIIRKVKPAFNLPADVDLDRLLDAMAKTEERMQSIQKGKQK